MSENIKVPDDMLMAALDAAGQTVKGCPWQEIATKAVEAAIRWLSENPIVPTEEQAQKVWDYSPRGAFFRQNFLTEWQRQMFNAPDPEVPEIPPEVRQQAIAYWESLHPNSAFVPIREIGGLLGIAYQCGKESK
jgi:hypothetical protein